MSSNHNKHSGTNGNFSSFFHPNKCKESMMHGRAGCWNWKTVALLFWLVVGFSGFIWFLSSFEDAKLGDKLQAFLTSEDNNTSVLSGNCNVSKHKLCAMARLKDICSVC